jgi:tricarballylate dehydrogenase
MFDVLVIGGGNAALCAALSAHEHGAKRVMLLESAPKSERGGNSIHTRNIRVKHDAPMGHLTDAYPEDEFFEDLLRVTAGKTTESLARLVIRGSQDCPPWMQKHGVQFQACLGGTLHLSRTNNFFLGGGKALVNAYFRSAEHLGITVRYDSPVDQLEIEDGQFKAAWIRGVNGQRERIAAKTVVVASGGFESNRDWLREAWGPAADQFLIRGCRFNMGVLLKDLIDKGAQSIGDATQGHCVAIDARAPMYDGGIVTRIDCVSLGIVVNKHAQRFYDEGEDFWPKRYAIWGRLVAQQPDQVGYSIIDAKAQGRFMPPVFPGETANTIGELANKIGLDPAVLEKTVNDYNAAVVPGQFDHAVLDNCHTQGLTPAKTHWAQRLDTPPFTAYPLRPGITFTYLGVRVNDKAQVLFNDYSSNLFAAGEIMAGNVLGQGYVAGVGMTIGTVFGRLAGQQAALAAQGLEPSANDSVNQTSLPSKVAA